MLCKRWFAAQTYPISEHLIVQGGTQCENIVTGMREVAGRADAVVLTGDDDYYGPGWISWVAKALESSPAVGQTLDGLYHIRADAWFKKHKVGPWAIGPLAEMIAFHVDRIDKVEAFIEESAKPKMICRWPEPHTVTDTPFIVSVKGLYSVGTSKKHDPWHFTEPDAGRFRRIVGDRAVEAYAEAMRAIDARETAHA